MDVDIGVISVVDNMLMSQLACCLEVPDPDGQPLYRGVMYILQSSSGSDTCTIHTLWLVHFSYVRAKQTIYAFKLRSSYIFPFNKSLCVGHLERFWAYAWCPFRTEISTPNNFSYNQLIFLQKCLKVNGSLLV